MRIVLSDKAKSDLFRIYYYIEERNPKAAEAFVRRVDAIFANLTQFPFIGRERSRLALGVRCLMVGLYLIFYTLDADEITVLRVIDGRMDIDEELHR